MRRRSTRALLTALAVATSALIPVAAQAPRAAAATACGMTFHAMGTLTGFPPFVGSLFYSAREGTSASAIVRVTPGCSDTAPGIENVVVNYVSDPGSATPDVDYTPASGSTPPMCDDVHAQCEELGYSNISQVTVPLTALPDGNDEAAVEAFRFRITGTTPTFTSPGYREPFNVPVYVVDANGAPRASLEPGAAEYSRSETFANILIPVFGAGATASVPYTVTPDPAAPATAGQDFNDLTGGSISIGPNGVGYINIGIVNDKIGEGPESVIISLQGTVDGSSSTKVTILDNEESVAPSSRFHHPRHKWKYKKSDYRIREFHVFAQDNEGGAGVVASEIALRRNMKNGNCAWLTTSGWQQKDCQNREWLPTKYDDVGQLFYLRVKQLKSSVGTKIKNYTAFSRAIDGADNAEKQFDEKRNANTFEIKRKRKRRG